ncbi:DUF192 domain-containing protein [Candidatus Woesearchaeota archaeon]|nr:DUF192 domain-containing protein [Candidatus Woesearchaeota archaeon]
MAIRNLTNRKVLASNSKICTSTFSKALGLMFSKKIKDRGFVFVFNREQRIMLHMVFVFFPIDILFLDSNNRVVDIKQNARPFQLRIAPRAKASYVIELPTSTISKSGTKVGDMIKFSD